MGDFTSGRTLEYSLRVAHLSHRLADAARVGAAERRHVLCRAASIGPLLEGAMARGGPRAVVEAFIRHFAGSENWDRLQPALRERMLANAETFLGVELDAFLSYKPDPAALLASKVPSGIGVGTERVPDAVGGARWLADLLRSRRVVFADGHAPYLDDPVRFAEALRSVVR